MSVFDGIKANEKPLSNKMSFVYAENEEKEFVRVSKDWVKKILGIATNLSELNNDVGFVDKLVSDLKNYYTKNEIEDKLSLVPRFSVQVVTNLPTENISETTVYLVPAGEDENNLYTEYINVDGLWEILGSQKLAKIELNKEEIESALGYVPADAEKVAQIELDLNEKLSETELELAIEEALRQAKESGEFNGTDGIGIKSIAKTSTEGLVDTYTITFTNEKKAAFIVTNGKDGRGIKSIEKTATNENIDTYTITFTDGEKFEYTVTNAIQSSGESFSGKAEDVTYDDTKTNLGADNVQGAIGKLSATVNDKVTNPTSGAVGQILEIETVDENGKPKTYKAVDKPTGNGGESESGTKNYSDLENKPQINGIELVGNKTSADLGIGTPTNEQVATAVKNAITENPDLVSTVQAKEITIDKLSNVTGIIDLVKQLPTTGQALRLGALTTAKTGDSIVIPVQPNDVVHYVINSYPNTFGSEYVYYGLWDSGKNKIKNTGFLFPSNVGKDLSVVIPENCYYIAFPLAYEGYTVDMSVYVNPTGNVLNEDEQLKGLYGLPFATSLEFEKYMQDRVKKINPNFVYKGRITGHDLPYLTTAEKYDCYLYSGKRLYEAYDDIVQTGDLIYSLGSTSRWKKAKLPYDTELMTIAETHCDICIVGGGAGGVACAYALKDSGYNVVLVEQLDSLGGTHTNGGVIELLPSPVPDFLKPICEDAYNSNFMTWKTSSYKVGSEKETDFDKWWRGGFINSAKAYSGLGNIMDINPFYMSKRYFDDLSPTIDIRFNRKFVSHKETDGVIYSIQCENKITGGIEVIHAHYFIDCTADGTLSRYGKTLDTDYFIGADAKTLYNESAIKDGFGGNHYEINSLEPTYLYSGINGNPFSFDKPSYRPDSNVTTGQNNKWDLPHKVNGTTDLHSTWTKVDGSGVSDGYYYTHTHVMSPDMNAGLTAEDYIDNGYEYTYAKGVNNAKAHFDKMFDVKNRFMGICKLLAMRETYRIKCDKMLVQSDIETLATSENIGENRYIALSSWYVDMHNNVSVNLNSITFKPLFGIPYECTIPTAYKNVLVACRGAGFSHISASACRLTKTMMSLGWGVGKAVAQARANWLDDMRNVDVAQLQTDCGVLEQLADIEAHFTLS